MARPHNPDDCVTCTEVPHLAAYRLPWWHICQRLGVSIDAVDKHTRTHPHLAAALSQAALDELRHAAHTARKHRHAHAKETTAA